MTTGSVLKVLIYVYDNYMLADPAEIPERRHMLEDLQRRGFSVSEVVHAMEWLSALVSDQRASPGSGHARDCAYSPKASLHVSRPIPAPFSCCSIDSAS